ncbi:MAG: transcriptional regulator [Hapalosiphonaceae cyanobacterium JJU2]|nr:MAG: transcriptional regulator [Hapalosiphonaceae cyanobacterium JJU2]
MIDDTSPQFDVFLCHNSEDKEAVIEIADKLESHNIRPWLDDWELQPGYPWQPELEKQIKNIKAAAVFVGRSGLGPWQEDEIYGFLRQFKQRKCPVIPVLLLDAPQQPQLPIFLEGITWVDFRQKTLVYTDPWQKLIWGITGRKPQRRPKQNQVIQADVVIQADDLSSEKGVDYTRLRDLLAADNWKEADEETLAVMLKASGREKEGWLDVESIENFPCTDLRTIDQLWVKYSNGRFGFSVQKRIWESVGGGLDADYETFKKFGDRVGWRVKGNWIDYPGNVNFSTSAPEGHLPYELCVELIFYGGKVIISGFFFLAQRLVKCSI